MPAVRFLLDVWVIGAAVQGKDQSQKRYVLIVEDEAVCRKALAALLRSVGYRIEAVKTAEEAVNLLDNGDRPDVALVDVDLPVMNGFDFVTHLHHIAPAVPAIVMSALDPEAVEPFCRDDTVHFMPKPLDFPRLLNALGPASMVG
jgi:CheY-like chemotaxis protein